MRRPQLTKESEAGGSALEFYPDIRLILHKGKDLIEQRRTPIGVEKVPVGNTPLLFSAKNRFAIPNIKIPITIVFGKGASNIEFLSSVMNASSFVKQAGAYFKIKFGDVEESVQGYKGLYDYVKQNKQQIYDYFVENDYFNLSKEVV